MASPTHSSLLEVLARSHNGERNSICGVALAERMGVKPRTIRALVLKLRQAAVPVCGRPETGYFLAETSQEIEATCALLEAHGLHQINVAAQMRRTTLPELLGQLTLRI